MENDSNDKLYKRSLLIKEYSLFALVASLCDGLLGYESNWVSFIGIGVAVPDKFEGLMVTLIFLVAWFLYGIVNGFLKKKGFIQFLSLYWGIGGAICLLAISMAPIGKFALIVIPVEILILLPNLGLAPNLHLIFGSVMKNNYDSLFIVLSVLLAWLVGVVGYLLGSEIRNFLKQSGKGEKTL